MRCTADVCVCVCESLICVQLFATPWTVACQAPLSIEFSRQEYWSGLPSLPAQVCTHAQVQIPAYFCASAIQNHEILHFLSLVQDGEDSTL